MDRVFFRHMRYARIPLLLTIVLGVLATLVLIVQMTFLSAIVDSVFLHHAGLAQVVLPLFLLLAAIVVHAALVWGREFAARQAAIRVKAELREQVFTHLLPLGPAYSKGEATGELVTTVSDGIERLDAYISRYLPQLAFCVLTPLMIVAYSFFLDWPIGVLLLITGPVIPLLMVLVGSYAEKHVQSQWLALSRMSAYFLDAIQGLTTLELFKASEAAQKRVAQFSESFRQRTLKMLRVAFLSGLVLEFMTAVAIGLVAVVLGVQLLNDNISFAYAFLILLLTPEFYRPLRELGVHRHAGMEGKAAAQRISAILETQVPLNETTLSFRRPASPLTVTFSNVTYTYPGSKRAALGGINLELPPNSCTALVGRSGAGKSTLVNLLLRFMDAQEGQIHVNSIPLTELPADAWREYIALVPQRPYLFSGSVYANIRLARADASEEEVKHAAELAGAAAFIEQLPQGYATEIGERGARLSAGQVQRLAIARAFLKDAPLLILDEPTSSLDPESELLIRKALEDLMRDRTVLIIAHRYNTIAAASRTAVLEDGRLVEVGETAGLLYTEAQYSGLLSTSRKEQFAI
jgi:ATP-binding cassette, subfamily C, bacterial CydD